MATTKKTEATPETPKEKAVPVVSDRVNIKIDRVPGQKEQDDVIITVNGHRYQIQRGVEVNVPVEVADAFSLWQRECNEAEQLAFELMN